MVPQEQQGASQTNKRISSTGQKPIEKGLTPKLSEDGKIVGFVGPDGNPVKLCLALEVEDQTAGYIYLTTQRERVSLGFRMLDRYRADFKKKTDFVTGKPNESSEL